MLRLSQPQSQRKSDKKPAKPSRETAIPEPKMVELIKYDEKGLPIFKMDVLETIIYRGEARDLPMIAISICGAHNSGKSFLLHVLLMYFRYQQHFDVTVSWTHTARLMRRGHWANSEHTDGIWIWNKVMKVNLKGKKVAVLLLDCQGSGQSADESIDMLTTYMAMRISHVQLYNVEPDWNISHLRMLEFAADALTGSKDLNLQSLIWLIRGCEKQDRYEEFPKALDERLKELGLESKSLAQFAKKTCFMMPSPGRKVLQVGKPNPAAAAAADASDESSDESQYEWPRRPGPNIRYDTSVVDMSLEQIDARDPTWDPPEGYSYMGRTRMYFLDPEAIPKDQHTYYKGVNFKLLDVDKAFTTAVRKVVGIITGRLLDVKELKTGAHVILAYRGMREMFKVAEDYCKSSEQICMEVLITEVFAAQEARIHDDMMNWMCKIQTMTMVRGWDAWRDRQLATARDAFASSRILHTYGDEFIEQHVTDFEDKLMSLDNEIYFFRLGVKYRGVAKELKAASDDEKEACVAKLADVYREVQENINKLFEGKSFNSPPFIYHNRVKLFKCGIGKEEQDLPAVDQFIDLFTKRIEVKDIVELVYPPKATETEGAGNSDKVMDESEMKEEPTSEEVMDESEMKEGATSEEVMDETEMKEGATSEKVVDESKMDEG